MYYIYFQTYSTFNLWRVCWHIIPSGVQEDLYFVRIIPAETLPHSYSLYLDVIFAYRGLEETDSSDVILLITWRDCITSVLPFSEYEPFIWLFWGGLAWLLIITLWGSLSSVSRSRAIGVWAQEDLPSLQWLCFRGGRGELSRQPGSAVMDINKIHCCILTILVTK